MNVYEAAQERLKIIFEDFDNVYVAFSGGKDSGIVLNLVIDYMRKHNIKRKVSVYHMDYEGQYQHTQEYLERMMTGNEDILDIYWVCLPLRTKCGVSMYDNFWLPWEPEKKNIWVRDLPKFNGVYHLEYGSAMKEVITAWPRTMLNSLTNPSINKRAFLGHCAVSFKLGISEAITRAAWKELTDTQRYLADLVAQSTIDEWKIKYENT